MFSGRLVIILNRVHIKKPPYGGLEDYFLGTRFSEDMTASLGHTSTHK